MQAAAAAAAALDEIFERMAAGHHETQVLGEHHGVQRISLEAAPQEKGAPLAQETPDHRHVEIHARGHVRHRESLAVDDIRQQQIIHVAAVAGHIDDLRAVADLLEFLDVLELHAVVQPVPQPAQQHRHEGDEGLRIIGGDFHGMLARDEQCGAARDGASRLGARRHFLTRRVPHGLALEDLRDARCARSPARSALKIRRTPRGALNPSSIASRRRMGSPKYTKALRPLNTTLSSF